MQMLLDQPPSSDDPDLPLRFLILGPDSLKAIDFAKRFDVRVGVAFNMTEISCAITSGWDFTDPRSCGRLRQGYPGYEVRLVDEHDADVEPGSVGELIVRTAVPWTLNGGYFGYPEKTAEAWRNGWFHTGDGLRVDDDGNYFFVDRFKEAIRRKGENISSYEVELEVGQHPAVAECAVIPVPGGDAGDEVKACVVLARGAALTPAELIEFLIPRMPRFMVPRYVEVLAELPKSEALSKVRKVELRRDPLNAATWDRVAAGIEIPR
jgi:crotonobetaine/carnitine-CoA ligase